MENANLEWNVQIKLSKEVTFESSSKQNCSDEGWGKIFLERGNFMQNS